MPILDKEPDIFPDNLFDGADCLNDSERRWWSVYTLSRREKDLMRRLHGWQIPFYGPVIHKRFRSPQGRMRSSYVPLFPNYVFLLATDSERYQAMTTNCISRTQLVEDAGQLVSDLRRIQELVVSGVALTPEARLVAGQLARIRSGPFAGYEGVVLRREGKTRFLVSVNFIEQGVSMEIDEGLLTPL